MEAHVSARFSPQTSQEMVTNMYQYLKYKSQQVDDTTCQVADNDAKH
jgi:hypothetical protein